MPDTYTPNLNLTKPEVGGSRETWGTKWNTNLDGLDTAIAARALRATEIGGTDGLTGGGSLAANRLISIADGGVSAAKIATGAVTASKIPNGTITNAHLSGGSVASLLTYTPANKAGDTFTGAVIAPSATISGVAPTITLTETDWGTRSIQCSDGLVGFLTSAGAWASYTDNSGNFVATGNVTAYSDARTKKEVTTIHAALPLIDQLRGVRYRRIWDDSKGVGVIAQEVQQVVPEVVQENADGTLSVAYGNLVAVLIEGIKELSRRVEQLEDCRCR